VEGTRVTLGFSPDGRPLPARAVTLRARSGRTATREHLSASAQAEAPGRQRQWGVGETRSESPSGVSASVTPSRRKVWLSSTGKELEEVRRSVYLAAQSY